MEILVLGPLEARSARARIPLGGPRQRALLADLVLHAGAVVSMDAIVDDLWGGAPPPTAEAVVQNAVARLRRVLGREAIDTRPPGYALRLDPGAIDARRFERLLHDARPLPSAERLAALSDALALWRGPAFADLAFESFLQDEITRLDELRLTALEDRIEAEIELGRHDDAIPDTATLASQHLDRERLCRLLMLALHRAGRQQEALDAYEATRRALDEQWGLEPSEETRALQRMILTQDPAIAPVQPAAVVVGSLRRPVSLLLVEPLLDDELELEAAGAVVDDVRRAVADVAARHGGALSPESGIELVAAFGVDGAHEDDVVRAARAAVEVREILRDRDVDARQALGNGRLLVKDSRPVLVGPVVLRTRRALRDAGANEIQLTAVAARLGGDAFDLDADGRLLGVRPGRPGRGSALAPLVGRTDELAGLHAAFYRAVETGKPAHAVVAGEAGIGKTRLVAAFVEELSSVYLEAACTPYGEGISFLPLRALAESAAWLDEDAPVPGELDSADTALAAARTLLEHFTASGPLVVVLDDLHWAAPTFLDLVEYVVRAVDGPLLVVSATRPELLERRPAWREGATTLVSLAADAARDLLDALPERDALDEKLADRILETAEGVPLFLEQLAAHAAESELGGGGIPASLDALLASRIDALEPGERAVLSRAAVVGRAFSRESLGALTPEGDARGLAGRLASLERHRLVRPRGTDHEFVHPLVRGAAYDAISRPDRAAMHEIFARWLDGRREGDELVGTHLERAALDSPDRTGLAAAAAKRLGTAGRRAAVMLDHAAARNLLERAAALLDHADLERLELECVLGEVLKATGEHRVAVDLLERVDRRARTVGDERIGLRARVEQVWPKLLDGSLRSVDADNMLETTIRRLTRLGDAYGVARAEQTYALLLGDFGNRSDLAREHLELADRAYQQAGLLDQKTGLSSVNLAISGTMPIPAAISLCEDVMSRRPDHVREQAYLQRCLADLLTLSGDLDAARRAATRAHRELSELGEEAALVTTVTRTLANIEIAAGNWPIAAEILESAMHEAGGQSLSPAWRAHFLALLGEVELGREDFPSAALRAEEARKLAPDDDLWVAVLWRRVAGRALASTGRPRKAVVIAREAVAIADTGDDLVARGAARLDLARVLALAGNAGEALEVLEEARVLLERKGATLLVGRSRTLRLEQSDGGARAHPSPADRHISS